MLQWKFSESSSFIHNNYADMLRYFTFHQNSKTDSHNSWICWGWWVYMKMRMKSDKMDIKKNEWRSFGCWYEKRAKIQLWSRNIPESRAHNEFGLRWDNLRNHLLIHGVFCIAPFPSAGQSNGALLWLQAAETLGPLLLLVVALFGHFLFELGRQIGLGVVRLLLASVGTCRGGQWIGCGWTRDKIYAENYNSTNEDEFRKQEKCKKRKTRRKS